MEAGFPVLPNYHALFVMLLTVVALFLFSRKNIALEISSLLILALLSIVFTVYPFVVEQHEFEAIEFFSGFGHEALITVCALMVIGQGLVLTGALEPFGRLLAKAWSISPMLSTLGMLILSALLSAFINNTPIVVLMLPILISVSLKTKTSPSKVLMPMGLATIVGGMTTTIGTSTNLLVVSVANDLGLPRMEMFDFFVPAIMGSGVAILYLWLIAPLLLKPRDMKLNDSSPRLFQARLHLNENSLVVGKTVADAKNLTGGEFNLIRIKRGNNYLMPLPDVLLKEGDRLRVMDTSEKIHAAAETFKATLYSGDNIVDDEHPLMAEDQVVTELAVVNGSILDNRTLRNASFLERYQLVVLGLHRVGREIWQPNEEIMDVSLKHGDVLLVQGDEEMIGKLKLSTDFLVLDASKNLPRTKMAPVAFVIMLAAVSLAAFGLLPIVFSSVAGALLMLLSKCLNMEKALKAISSSVIFIVVASLAIGKALEVTGGSLYMTEVFLYFFMDASPIVILSALMLLIGILTNIISNNAAAVIGTPIAISIARQLGVPPEPFVLAVLFGANLSFATPMSYKTNLLVMSAGNYSFSDFVKVGAPLTLIMWMVYTVILGYFYL